MRSTCRGIRRVRVSTCDRYSDAIALRVVFTRWVVLPRLPRPIETCLRSPDEANTLPWPVSKRRHARGVVDRAALPRHLVSFFYPSKSIPIPSASRRLSSWRKNCKVSFCTKLRPIRKYRATKERRPPILVAQTVRAAVASLPEP